MTRIALASGQPLAEARRQMRRTRQSLPLPTGEATTATSIFWNATPVASATPHTKGSWIQLVAATTADIYGLLVFSTTNTSSSAADSSSLLDVGVGASGSEVVAVADLAMGYRGAGNLPYRVPVFIPSGSRIALRLQGAQVSKTYQVGVIPYTRTFSPVRPSSTVAALNAASTSSHGTALTVPGGTNAKGAWTQLVAATTEPYTSLMLGLQGNAGTAFASTNCLVDLGLGASGAEVVAVPNICATASSAESLTPTDQGAWLVDVPAGTRIAARYQIASLATTLDAIVYGIR
jgi:hypothetical protein